jgi:hypothetical protein
LNGKRYDAVTGEFLGVGQGTEPAKKRPAVKGRAIDGFIRPTTTNTQTVPHAKPAPTHRTVQDIKPLHKQASQVAAPKLHPTAMKPVAKPATAVHAKAVVATPKARPATPKPAAATLATTNNHPAKVHKPARIARAHTPERSQTLMRRAVHKPQTTIKPAIRPQAPAEIAPKSASALMKRSALQVDPARLERAKQIVRHAGIRRFMPVHPDHTPAAVAATPRHSVHEVPVIAVKSAPAREHRPKSHHDIFETALAHADSHKQPPHPLRRSRSRRIVNTLAIVGAFLVIGSFITYLNIPNIQLHIASVQAGFKADLPDYRPTGYDLTGGVRRTGNTVSMTFRSGENNFTITQQPSDWNSQTLVENTLALSGDKHKTIEASGRTIYVYEGSNAVWVNGGVRYDLNTNAPLSTDDISKLAGSL